MKKELFKINLPMDYILDLSDVGESLGNWIGYETDGLFTYEDFDESGNNINTVENFRIPYGTPWICESRFQT